MQLLKEYGLNVPRGNVAQTPEEAAEIARTLGWLVSALAIAGGRWWWWGRRRGLRVPIRHLNLHLYKSSTIYTCTCKTHTHTLCLDDYHLNYVLQLAIFISRLSF